MLVLRPASPCRNNLPSHGCVWVGLARRSPGRLAGLLTGVTFFVIRHNSVDLSNLGPSYAMSEQNLMLPATLPQLLANDL